MLSAHDPSTGNERTAALLLQLADEVDAEETVRARRRKLRLWLLPAAGLGAAATLLGSWTLGLGALGAALYGWLRVARSGKPGDEGAGLDPGSDPRRAGSILPGGGTPPR